MAVCTRPSAVVSYLTKHSCSGLRHSVGHPLEQKSSFFFPGSESTPDAPARSPFSQSHQLFHSTTALQINRFLFDVCEVDQTSSTDSRSPSQSQLQPTVTLPKHDYRTIHAAKVLNLQNGDTIRAGIVGEQRAKSGDDKGHPLSDHAGFITDEATIQWIPEGKIKKAQPTKNGDPPGSIRVSLQSLAPPSDDVVSSSASSSVSLILALPRPLQLGRILPMVAQLGVDHLVLTSAGKVPKDYFGSHLFRRPHELRRLLVEGLCQAGDARIPTVTVVRSLKIFLEDEVEEMFPPGEFVRVVAHPQRNGSDSVSCRMRDVTFPELMSPPRIVLAVGPEGGWVEDYELDLFKRHGFQQITLGTRVLRSDVAVVSLLSLAHDACAARAAETILELTPISAMESPNE